MNDSLSSFDLKSIEYLMKASGHEFKNFPQKCLHNSGMLQWMNVTETYAPTDYKMLNDIYSFLKSSNVDFNSFLLNESSIVYTCAKEFALIKNKNKISKKNKQILIVKYYNLFKSEKMKNYILFQQSMYVLLNC